MNPEQQAKIDTFLNRPGLIGRLATVSPDGQPHVVPVWYLWEDGLLWVHSFESTLKVKQLRQNPRCAMTVDLEHSENGMMGVLIKGQAEFIQGDAAAVRALGEKIYKRYLNETEMAESEPQGWLNSPEGLILKITPKSIKLF